MFPSTAQWLCGVLPSNILIRLFTTRRQPGRLWQLARFHSAWVWRSALFGTTEAGGVGIAVGATTTWSSTTTLLITTTLTASTWPVEITGFTIPVTGAACRITIGSWPTVLTLPRITWYRGQQSIRPNSV